MAATGCCLLAEKDVGELLIVVSDFNRAGYRRMNGKQEQQANRATRFKVVDGRPRIL
jgi:hypothetical protein